MRALAFAWLAAFASTFASMAARADEPLSLRYDINSSEIQQGETFQLDVVLTVHSNEQVEELDLPEFPKGVSVVQERKASSTSIGAVNGRRSVTTEQRFMYILRGDEAGTFHIPEATARMGKSVAKAPSVAIKIIAADAAPATAEPAGSIAGARFGKNPPAAFLEVTVDHETAYVGEQITATTEVYSMQPLSQWPRVPPMKPAGFLCTPLLGDDRPNPTQKSVAGKSYYVYLINKDALFPLAPGEPTLPAQQMDLVPAGSFFARPRDISVRSSPVKVKVKALPSDDKPARFVAGNVGVWSLGANVRPSLSASLDQPLTLSIVATGTGSLEQLQLPSWDGGDMQNGGARVFPATSKIERRDVTLDNPELGGRVISEMLIQPQKEGDLRIPGFSLSYFDPYSGAYKTSSTQPIVVKVHAGHGGASVSSSSTSAGLRNTIAKGARPLRTHASAESAPGDAPVYAGAFVFIAGLGAFVSGARKRKRSASDEGKRARIRNDRKRALDDAKERGDLAGLERVLLEALADRCGADVKARATGDLGPLLEQRGMAKPLVDDVVALITEAEAARYSPAGGERARVAERCIAMVARVEAAS